MILTAECRTAIIINRIIICEKSAGNATLGNLQELSVGAQQYAESVAADVVKGWAILPEYIGPG